MNSGITIRKERIEECKTIRDITRSAFKQDEEANLVDRLRKNKQVFIPALSLVAAIGPKIVGHIMFTEIRIVNNNKKEFTSLALAPVSVAPDFQNRGIGSMLIRYGLGVATKLGYTSVIVLGHEHYYPRFGFCPAKKWDIKPPFDVPENVFMAIELAENGLANISGTVRYPDEFGGM